MTQKKCQKIMEGYTGRYSSNECGRPAKFIVGDSLRGNILVCGIHARRKLAVPLNPKKDKN